MTDLDFSIIVKPPPRVAISVQPVTPAPPVVDADLTAVIDMIATHIIDPTPHPAYDDMVDLTLLFNNQLI